jgi:hypothetical protein
MQGFSTSTQLSHPASADYALPQIGGWYPLRQIALVHIVMRHFVVLSVAEAISDSHIRVHHRS